jgi:DNA-directed RNA polymerase subunit K/omega
MVYCKLPSIEDMFAMRESRYALTMAVARRAREITLDHELRGEILEENAIKLAAEDFKNNLYQIVPFE